MTAAEHDLDALVDEVDRRRRNDRHQKWGLFILVMLSLTLAAVVYVLWAEASNRAEHSGAQVVVEQEEKKEIAKEAQQALCREGAKEIFDRELCEYWATVAEEPPVPLPEDAAAEQAKLITAFRAYCAEGNNCKGKDGEAPTADDIAAAFVKFCANGRCTGPAGKDAPPAKDGKDAVALAPEFGMVLAAVTEYCQGGTCVGPTGPAGPVGPAGKDGNSATPEMVLAAVQHHCADGACLGEKGDKGDTGEKGEPGQNVTLVSWTDPRTGDKYTCTPNPPGSTTLTCSVEPGAPPPVIPGVGP